MTDLVSARRATSADLSTTAEIGDSELRTVRDERGGRWHLDHDVATTDSTTLHKQALDEPDRHLVVGCIDNVVVGYGVAALSATATGQLCMIDELVVHPKARAIGVGSEILRVVREWATEQQCEAIESQVLPGNRAAKNFFERVGMKTRKMRVSADLG